MHQKSIVQSALIFGLVMVLMLSASIASGSSASIPAGGTAGDDLGPDIPVPVGYNFTYQGRLVRNGSPADGYYDFQFLLYNELSGGTLLATDEHEDVNVRSGMFTVVLNFEGDYFNGWMRFIEVSVRPGTSTGDFISLSPRHATLAKPYALWAGDSARLNDQTADFYQERVDETCSSGYAIQSIDADGSVNCTAAGGATWMLSGNGGTSASNFIGTTDHMTLTLKVFNHVGLRLVPAGDNTPNVIGGHAENTIASGVEGAAIGGGGSVYPSNNIVTDNFGTIGGGAGNIVGDEQGTTVDARFATVGGGTGNKAGSDYSVVAGGQGNSITDYSGSIGGGRNNIVSGWFGTVPGGSEAEASHFGELAFAAGGFDNTPGTAQTSIYVLRNTTGDDQTTSLFLDGYNDLLTIAQDRSAVFDILIVGRADTGETVGYQIQGVIANIAGTVATVGTPVTTTLGEDMPNCNAFAAADDANDALDIRVTGLNVHTIYWVATVRTVEVQL